MYGSPRLLMWCPDHQHCHCCLCRRHPMKQRSIARILHRRRCASRRSLQSALVVGLDDGEAEGQRLFSRRRRAVGFSERGERGRKRQRVEAVQVGLFSERRRASRRAFDERRSVTSTHPATMCPAILPSPAGLASGRSVPPSDRPHLLFRLSTAAYDLRFA
jgi:hypothetical protein